MAPSDPSKQAPRAPHEVFTPEELRNLVNRIQASGELGRSKVYITLLNYLIECSASGKSPKEFEIALDALGKGSDFDVSKDSAVRVYVHQLRKKLDSYYQSHDKDAEHRIVIPKGQYAVAAISNRQTLLAGGVARFGFDKLSLTNGLIASIAILLVINLMVILASNDARQSGQGSQLEDSTIWQKLLDDDLPILLVMGDYYIFGELNDNGNIGRMVREFNINSREDLEDLHFSDWEATHNYQDLNLSYMPEGSAYALTQIIPIFSSSSKRLNITMMSDLTTSDLRSNHIIYIGYISALDKLIDLAFAASDLKIGRSYDELLNLKTGRYYTSDAGLPEAGQQFRDYGFFTTFPASSENQVVLISGMRDAGLMHTAQVLSDKTALTELEQQLQLGQESEGDTGLEALYEVFGMDRMNFEGSLVYSKTLDASRIWGRDNYEFAN
jgi:hypothetical protein